MAMYDIALPHLPSIVRFLSSLMLFLLDGKDFLYQLPIEIQTKGVYFLTFPPLKTRFLQNVFVSLSWGKPPHFSLLISPFHFFRLFGWCLICTCSCPEEKFHFPQKIEWPTVLLTILGVFYHRPPPWVPPAPPRLNLELFTASVFLLYCIMASHVRRIWMKIRMYSNAKRVVFLFHPDFFRLKWEYFRFSLLSAHNCLLL